MRYKEGDLEVVYMAGAIQQNAVATFMNRVEGQIVRTTPTTDITHEERVLRVKLVIEEAMEFAEAMGVIVSISNPHSTLGSRLKVLHDDLSFGAHAATPIDIVAAADAIADLTYVVEGSACTLGIETLSVFGEVHRSNMEKLNGPIREDGKQLKPEGWQPPDVAGELRKQGWGEPASSAAPALG